MKAEGLLRESKLDEAVDSLSEHLKDNPGDSQGRTFLFELLCFRGEYDRAAKHLALLGNRTKDAAVGALLYESALHAEKLRAGMFETGDLPTPLAEDASRLRGSLNGKPFSSLLDADPRIGARLEVFAAGDYLWVPLSQVASIEMGPPTRLRDLLWASAVLRMSEKFRQRELGEVLLPVLSPLSFQHPDAQVRLGRVTEWCRDEQGREAPYGQKMLVADGVEIPFLEIRKVEIAQSEAAAR